MSSTKGSPPLVLHLVYRFGVGGLENGVVNLINRLPFSSFRHAVVSLTDIDQNFCKRLLREDVMFLALRKPPGHTLRLYPRLFRLMRELNPAILHTRNIAPLEAVVPAWMARVPVRIHGEHGRDIGDLDGTNHVYKWVRRVYSPFVSRYVALSQDFAHYLRTQVRISPDRIEQIYNGVDTDRFSPRVGKRRVPEGATFGKNDEWIVGTVGRLAPVKHHVNLAKAFVRALQIDPVARRRMRLAVVGDGEERENVERVLAEGNALDLAWFPGERADIPDLMRFMDCFVLPSLAEGISNTILEAMASQLPVVATRVGGNAELVADGLTGKLIPAADPDALARAILDYFGDQLKARRHGRAARMLVEQRFSLDAMVNRYHAMYSRLLNERGLPDTASATISADRELKA